MLGTAYSTSRPTSVNLDQIRDLVASDLKAVDKIIINELSSNITLIRDVTQHILKSGGKRIRPLVVLLSACALGYADGTLHHELAAIIEFVHTATLLHDDVVDESSLRRGQKTANAVWGNSASVLVGDFLYSRAFQLLTSRSHVQIMRVLANTTNAIAEGEVMQLMDRHQPEIDESHYLEIIYRKTAKLFESAAEIGAILGTPDSDLQKDMATYGLHLGLAFQIIDDVLDYTANPDEIGKNIGDDLMEGKTTLPLIYALQNSSPNQANQIRQAIADGGIDQLNLIVEIIKNTQAAEYCIQKANVHVQTALSALKNLPKTPYKQGLQELIHFVTTRNY